MHIEQLYIFHLVCLAILINTKLSLAQGDNDNSNSSFNNIGCGYKGPSLADDDNANIPNNTDHQFTVAGPREFRWMVIIQITTPITTRHNWCAGTLINSQWVLTAAHCAVNLDNGTHFDPKMLTVVAGAYNLAKTDEQEKATRVVRNVTHIEVPESYHVRLGSHDISLLRLSAPLEMLKGPDYHLNAICLPKVLEPRLDRVFGGQQCIVTGWDDVNPETIDLTDNRPVLRIATPIISNEDCVRQYKGHLDPIENIVDSMLCTGGKSVANRVQVPSTCRLLPGGPVSCYDPVTYQWTMVAVNSGTFTTNCHTKRLPDVNMALDDDTIEWIQATLRNHTV